jgi:Rhodopirellula transposase DDE domain
MIACPDGTFFPPATGKWNKIELRLLPFLTANGRATPLVSYQTIFLSSHFRFDCHDQNQNGAQDQSKTEIKNPN